MSTTIDEHDYDQRRRELRAFVRGAYDLQELRIQTGSRLVANFKAKLGQAPSKREDGLSSEAKMILSDLREAYRRLTDGIATFPRMKSFEGNEVISSYSELCFTHEYIELEKVESTAFRNLVNILSEFEIWTTFLKDVRGCGPAMAAVIISELDISKSKYASSLCAYAGLDVYNGSGRSRREEHRREVEYIDRNGKKQTRLGLTYNPWLKSKLLAVLGGSFLKSVSWRDLPAGAEKDIAEDWKRWNKKKEVWQQKVLLSPYAKVYYDYKNRLENHAKWGIAHDGENKDDYHNHVYPGRRHRMAMRYMIKIFLQDLYKAWRPLVGLPVYDPYHEAKLGLYHDPNPPEIDTPNVKVDPDELDNPRDEVDPETVDNPNGEVDPVHKDTPGPEVHPKAQYTLHAQVDL